MARPTEYNAKRPGQAEFVCEHWGADDRELAKSLGISPATLYDWRKIHPEFSEAVSRGKAAYDNTVVERAIRDSAIGYEYSEEVYDAKKGAIVRLRKYHQPDPRAQALWQMNRQGWRPPGTAKQLGAGVGDGGGGGQAAGVAVDPREAELAREILEVRHSTTIRVAVESREVERDGEGKVETSGKSEDKCGQVETSGDGQAGTGMDEHGQTGT